jgi:excisionase family DNA binding protein
MAFTDPTEESELSAEQAAELLGWSVDRVRAAVRRGLLPNAGENGTVRIQASELREFIENRGPLRLSRSSRP